MLIPFVSRVLGTASLTALLLAPLSATADSVSLVGYDCFDATQSTGIGQPFSGTCTDESPFAPLQRAGDFQYFHFEDWESFSLNNFVEPVPVTVPGVEVSAGGAAGVTVGGFSPDSDDGVVDGTSNGLAGLQTVFTGSGATVTITFDTTALGGLPTHTAIVATSVGTNATAIDVTAEFFAAGGTSLGTVVANFGQVDAGDSSDDAFLGWTDTGGIESISLTISTNTGFNLDHLQYGLVPPPVPMLSFAPQATVFVLLLVTALITIRPRRTPTG